VQEVKNSGYSTSVARPLQLLSRKKIDKKSSYKTTEMAVTTLIHIVYYSCIQCTGIASLEL